jgi:predicted transcriptional regulator
VNCSRASIHLDCDDSINLIKDESIVDTRVVTAHLPAELAKRLDGLAERLDRPKGWIVKEAIASFINLEEQRHRLTIEALADVDAGRMLDHMELEAWADNLGKPPKRRARS